MGKVVALFCKFSAVLITGYALYAYLKLTEAKNIWALLGIGLVGLLISNFALSVDVSKVLESIVALKKTKEE
jgi:hypothetical protein